MNKNKWNCCCSGGNGSGGCGNSNTNNWGGCGYTNKCEEKKQKNNFCCYCYECLDKQENQGCGQNYYKEEQNGCECGMNNDYGYNYNQYGNQYSQGWY